jgi:selenocysteine-specific elongation factor
LKLQEEVLVLPGDRFIVRQFSPVVTIGGGAVLDPLARRPMLRDTGRAAFLETLERGIHEEILAAMTERALLGLGYEEIVARTGWMEAEIQAALKKLHGTARVRMVANEPLMLVSGKLFEEVRKRITDKVEKFQKENPLLPGILREDLRASLGKRVRSETFRAALDELVAQKKLDAPGDLVKKAGSEIALLPEEAKAKEQIEAAFASAGLTVPTVKEVLAKLTVEAKRAEKLLQILLREKNLVRVSPELVFHRQALAQLKEQLAAYKKSNGDRITVPIFKELTGITRKYAIPLLEYLDRERVTRRAGDERVIL